MNTGPREWDAETYDRISEPQYEWGLKVLERLELTGDEYVMDAGCSSAFPRAASSAWTPRSR
jgi:trans-aconitate 2-methyltransferase